MYIMFLDVTHQHSDKKWVPQSRSPIFFFAGLPPRTPPKWQLSLRQPTPGPSFSLRLGHRSRRGTDATTRTRRLVSWCNGYGHKAASANRKAPLCQAEAPSDRVTPHQRCNDAATHHWKRSLSRAAGARSTYEPLSACTWIFSMTWAFAPSSTRTMRMALWQAIQPENKVVNRLGS